MILLVVAFSVFCAADVAVKLENIRSLLFFRTSPVINDRRVKINNGTQCEGAYCNLFYMPNTIACQNVGFKTAVVDWRCKTDTSVSCIQMQNATVKCDGFSSPDDPEVSLGSCRVVYNLALVHEGCLGYKTSGNSSVEPELILHLHVAWAYTYAVALVVLAILMFAFAWIRPPAFSNADWP